MYLTINQLNKSFPHKEKGEIQVLDDISLTIDKGQFVSILGPSGCGKSTLLYLIAGLEELNSGEISLNGKPIKGPGSDRVVVFQEAGLFPWLTVLENVTYGLLLKKMNKQEAEDKAIEMLKMVHLKNYIHAYPHQLSGGMKQRVSIARALVMEPEILLMDEPFAALDEQTRMVLHKELLDIWRKTKVTIIFITHNIREAVQLSEKIVVLATRPGRVKREFTSEVTKDGYTPNDVTLHLEKQIMAELQGEIEKVLKEEMGDDYNFKTDHLHRDPSDNLGSFI